MKPTPLLLFLRSLQTPTRDMTVANHARMLAQHRCVSPQILEDHVALCEHLTEQPMDAQQAQEALEWMLLRMPGSKALQHEKPDLPVLRDLGDRIDALVAKLVQQADLSLPIGDATVLHGMDDTPLCVGDLLLALGHTVSLEHHRPDPGQLAMLARLAAGKGDFDQAAALAQIASKEQREHIVAEMWNAISKEGKQTPEFLGGMEALPDPPASWWSEVQSTHTTLNGDNLAKQVLLDRPHALPDYIQGVLNAGELVRVHPTMQQQAWQARASWAGAEGWEGSALCVLSARAKESDNWLQLAHTLLANAPDAAQAPDSGPLANTYLLRLLHGACNNQPTLQEKQAKFAEKIGLKKLTPKACLLEVEKAWPDYPRGPLGQLSEGLCALTGRAVSGWSTERSLSTHLLPLLRHAYMHPQSVRAIQAQDQAAIEAQAVSVRALAGGRAPGKVSETTPLMQGNAEVEFMLWNFASERLGRMGKGITSDELTPRQKTLIENIKHALELGFKPEWDAATANVALALLANERLATPGGALAQVCALIQGQLLQATPQSTHARARNRL